MSEQLQFQVDTRALVAAKTALDAVTTASRTTEKAATELSAATRRVGQADAALLSTTKQVAAAVTQQATAVQAATRAAQPYVDASGRLREANGRFASSATKAAAAAGQFGTAAQQAAQQSGAMTGALGKARSEADKLLASAKKVAGALGLAFTAREAMSLADAYTTMTARLRLVTQSEQERSATLRTLNEIADRTRTQVTDTAELYVKLRQANEGLGYTTGQTAQLTEAFGLALKVSGASGATAASAITQFAQAMSKGAATGDEFVTISEAAPEVLRIVQKELGVSRAKLLEMREAGELTSKVIGDSLVKNLERLRGQVGEAPRTIADGFVALRNGVIRLLGSSQDLQTATKNIAEGLASLGRFLEENGPVLVGLAKAAALFWGVTRAVTAAGKALATLNGAAAAGGAAGVIKNLVTLAGGPFGFAVRAAALAVGGAEIAAGRAVAAQAANVESRRQAFSRLSPEDQARTMQALEGERRRLERLWYEGDGDGPLMGEERETVARAMRANRENLDLFRGMNVGTGRVTVSASAPVPGASGSGRRRRAVDPMPAGILGGNRGGSLFTIYETLAEAQAEAQATRARTLAAGRASINAQVPSQQIAGNLAGIGADIQRSLTSAPVQRALRLQEEAAEARRQFAENLKRGVFEGLQQPIAEFLRTWKLNTKAMGDMLRDALANAIASVIANELTKLIYAAGRAIRDMGREGGGGSQSGFQRVMNWAGTAQSVWNATRPGTLPILTSVPGGPTVATSSAAGSSTFSWSAAASTAATWAARLAPPVAAATLALGFGRYVASISGGNAAARRFNEANARRFRERQMAMARFRAQEDAYFASLPEGGSVSNAPSDFDVSRYRALALTGNQINVVVPQGTTTQQVDAILDELTRRAMGQSGNPAARGEVNVS